MLARNSSVKRYAKNSVIYVRGDEARYLNIVLQGWFKLTRDTKDEGEEIIVDLLAEGQSFGVEAVFGDDEYSFSAQAAEEGALISIPITILRQLIRTNPDIAIHLAQMMARSLNKLQLENEHLTLMSASQRVGCLFLQLWGEDSNGGNAMIALPYDKSLAAAQLGMKPETFSRALAQLRSLGITIKGNEILIPDIHALVKFVCASCSAGMKDCKFGAPGSCSSSDCKSEYCHRASVKN